MARWQEYSELWICLNCRNIGPLTEHGRCETCDSDSVAVADRGRPVAKSDAQQLADELRLPALVLAGGTSHPPAPRMVAPAMRERRARGHRRTSRYG